MKLNEFGADKKVQEGYAWNAIKQFGKNLTGQGEDAGMSAQDKYAKDFFIKSFVSRASGALNAQVSSGAVDPNLQMSVGPAASAPRTKPKKNKAPAAPAPAAAPAAAPAPAQQTPAQRQQQRLAAATQTARAQMTPKPAAPKPAAPTVPAPQQAAAGSRARLQATRQARRLPESSYEKLDAIFESILMEAESIGDYVRDFTFNYMKNDTNIQDPKFTAEIDRLAKEIETTYPRDKGVAALRKLATFAYGQAQVGNRGQSPMAQQPGATQQNPAMAQQVTQQNLKAKQIKTLLSQMTVPQQKKVLAYLQQSLGQPKPAAPATPAATNTTP